MTERRYYYLSLEGMSELAYFERLRDLLNAAAVHPYRIELECAVEHSPKRTFKRLKMRALAHGDTDPVIWHVRDVENPSENRAFLSALRDLKQHNMRLCYSNYTFELWLLLHKCRMAEKLADKRNYLKYINKYFDTSYFALHEFKERGNMKKLLAKLTLNDILTAIENADSLMEEKARISTPSEFCGFTYYTDNPATTVQELVRTIYFGLPE